MRRRSLITFVVLNVLISIGVAAAVIAAFAPKQQQSPEVVPIYVAVTATNDPNATERVIIITATPLPGQQQSVGLPTGLFDATAVNGAPIATLDPELLSQDAALQGTATALPQNCIPYVVKEGDTPFAIAQEYGADGFALMEVNGLTEETASSLQIGDTLIIPLEGCSLTAADLAPTEEEAPTEAGADSVESAAVEETDTAAPLTDTPRPTVRPTLTVPPTAVNAQVIIRDVIDPGDITSEAVEIQNTGATVNIAGWTLNDSEGNAYTFEEQLLFSEARVTVYTRAGRNTPVLLYWGRDEAVWQSGDVVTLTDRNGSVQSTYRIP